MWEIIETSCNQTNEGFVVLKGSHIETIDSQSIPFGIKENRKSSKIDDQEVLQYKEYFFSI